MKDEIQTLCRSLLDLLTGALDTLPPQELLTDRQALRNITGALRDLQALCEEQTAGHGAADSGIDAAPAYTVRFLGETEELSK